MKNPFTEYLYYNRAERIGTLVLCLLCVLLVLSSHFLHRRSNSTPDFTVFEREIESWESKQSQAEQAAQVNIKSTPKLFAFNPNTISKDSLILLGLSAGTAQTILNYRSKGGQFFEKDDLKKIYTLEEKQYLLLEPFINLPQTDPRKQDKPTSRSKRIVPKKKSLFTFNPNSATKEELQQLGLSLKLCNTILKYRRKGGQFRSKNDFSRIFGLSSAQFKELEPFISIPQTKAITIDRDIAGTQKKVPEPKIDVNKATREDWISLRGIGPYYADKICRFRDKLGGFYSIEQIAETYNLPDSSFQKIKSQLLLSPLLKKININEASVKELANHPYIRWKEANILLNYRNQHGPFRDLNEINNILAFKPEFRQKILPYLEIR